MSSLTLSLTIEPNATAPPEATRAVCVIANTGDDVVSINLAPLSSPSLALEITDESGRPVPLPPPSLPPAEIPVATLAPGESRTADFTGFVPAATPPGRYRVRFRYIPGGRGERWSPDPLWSSWADLEVR